jgi:phosphoribosylanthranilate isomerase
MQAVMVKICGLTRVKDVQAAVTAGADAIGFVFTASPRQITPAKAVELSQHIPQGILRIGLFLDQIRAEVDAVIRAVPLDVLQFHGRETDAQCDVFGLPYLKAVSMQDDQSAQKAERDFPGAKGLLLDSHIAGKAGGSGKVFDWNLLQPVSRPVWLAGGLDAGNVGHAIEIVKPYAVDVSSGVEASPGIKDPNRIAAFIDAVRQQEQRL